MAANESIDPRVLAIAQWPEDAPCGAVSTFCAEHGISRKSFNKVDSRHGLDQVLIITDGDTLTVTDLDGEILIEHHRPAPGVNYVGNGQRRGRRPKTTEASPKS